MTARAFHRGEAVVSPDGRYRYWLKRSWGEGQRVCWVMLNPSIADATVDDPTIRKCIEFSRRHGFGSLIVVNLYAAIATDPKALRSMDDPIGPDNPEAIELALNGSNRAWVAWGAGATDMDRAGKGWAGREHVVDVCRDIGLDVWCLGTTRAGEPRHPGRIGYDTPLVTWPVGEPVSEVCAHDPWPDLSGFEMDDWLAEMSRTHVQRRCDACGLWAIFEPKDGDA